MGSYSPHFLSKLCKGVHKVEVLLEPGVELRGPDTAVRASLEKGVLQSCFRDATILLQKI